MLSPHVCPRCHSPIKAGRLACARCGLALDPTTNRPSKIAPITRPLAVPERSTSRQSTPNRAIGGVLTSALVLALVVAAGVTQMNSSADGSPTPVPSQLTASRTISTNIVPPTAFVLTVTPAAIIQSPTTAQPPSPSLPMITATSTATHAAPSATAIPPTRTGQATNTAEPAPSSTPAPTHTPTPQPAIPPTTAPTQPPATLPPTAPPPPPATPKPTPRPVPGIGGTANDWNGWTVGVATMASRQQINSQSSVVYAPSGTFWLIWIDARNDGTSTRSLGDTVDFLLQDGSGDLYTELSDHGYGGDTREIARIFGRHYLNTPVAPGGVTRTLLVFDIPSGATPNELIGRRIIGGRASLSDPVRFDLTR